MAITESYAGAVPKIESLYWFDGLCDYAAVMLQHALYADRTILRILSRYSVVRRVTFGKMEHTTPDIFLAVLGAWCMVHVRAMHMNGSSSSRNRKTVTDKGV